MLKYRSQVSEPRDERDERDDFMWDGDGGVRSIVSSGVMREVSVGLARFVWFCLLVTLKVRITER